MNKRIASLFLLILINAFSLAMFANSNSSSGLAVELTYYKGKPPVYQSVAESSAKAKWAWYSLFGRIAGFQNTADRPVVRAVKFVPYLENEAVKINVTVYSGDKFFENEEAVGVYTMRENERIKIKELANFGVEPFEIAVVRVSPSSTVVPSIVNNTNSLQVTSVVPNFSTLPTYLVTFLNTSQKDISAFIFETTANNQRRLSGMPQSGKGEPLIKAGASITKEFSSALKNQQFSGDQIPPIYLNETFIIKSVVFTDGSYEGDAAGAAMFRAFAVGRKSQLKKIIGLVQTVGKNNVNAIAEKALKLEIKVDQSDFSELLKDFPNLEANQKNSLNNAAEIASNHIKTEFVKDLELQIKISPGTVSKWLETTAEQYQKWMTLLP